MLTFLRTSLFESPAQTLVNTVNIEGVMGKGIAKEFKARFPEMFKAYKKLCDQGTLQIGKLHIWRDSNKWVLNFPTKSTWRQPSKISYIEEGLKTFVDTYKSLGITSVSFPPLGCGNGNLKWTDVKPIMEKYLSPLDIAVYVHDQQVSTSFIPEHQEKNTPLAPSSFLDFLTDIRGAIQKASGQFKTIESGDRFSLAFDERQSELLAQTTSRSIRIPLEIVELIWATLQVGPITSDNFSAENDRKSKSYLFPALLTLPYVRLAQFVRNENGAHRRGHALYLASDTERRPAVASDVDRQTSQLCLSL